MISPPSKRPSNLQALPNSLSIAEFINNNKWTDDDFEDEEKIQGNIQITIVEDPSSTSFVADVLIQSIRPVYGSDYSTQLLNFLDKQISFNYVELQPLETNTNEYKDNLSSVLVFGCNRDLVVSFIPIYDRLPSGIFS